MDDILENIMASVKKSLGIDPEYEAFDVDILLCINSVFFTLNQLGIGPEEPFVLQDGSESWSDFGDTSQVEALKPYIYLKTKMMFDPPSSSFVNDSFDKQIKELEWRLNVAVDKGGSDV